MSGYEESSAMNPLMQEQPLNAKNGKLRVAFQWVVCVFMWALVVAWIGSILVFPFSFAQQYLQKMFRVTSHSYLGTSGSILLLFAAPPVMVALLGAVYLAISPKETNNTQTKFAKLRLWTFPALIDGPFGVVSAAELIVIMVFVIYIIGSMVVYIIRDNKLIAEISSSSIRRILALELIGLRLGSVGLFCLGFLFLPVARGSVLLRLANIPFEHAAKYHVWLGHVTMGIFTAHGLCYLLGWGLSNTIQKEIIRWQNTGIANIPGEISLLAGLAMWVTSLHYVRQQYFELFFYTHQLYVIFVAFLALHVGDFIFCIAAAGIFFFLLDRFIRFCQSRRVVEVLSARCLPCETIELVISKPPGLDYNALSFVFIQIKNLSWLQWHPFSVSSSPYDGKNHLSILIKPLGKWTIDLKNLALRIADQPQNLGRVQATETFILSVEGPYGHEAAYHLSYNKLVLVAGGIGISPFIAILRDILHRARMNESGLPKSILLIWAVKRSSELNILDLVDEKSICPNFSDIIDLEVEVYVTQESEPDLESFNHTDSSFNPTIDQNRLPMSCLVGTGNVIWAGIYLASSVAGFFVTMWLVKTYYITPYQVVFWWVKGMSLLICMILGIVLFGGASLLLWNIWEYRLLTKHKISEPFKHSEECLESHDQKDATQETKRLVEAGNTFYGRRPDFKEIFGRVSNNWGNGNVGIMVCGPPTLQTSVARECRSFNLKNTRSGVIFHFNSHSFDL